MQLPLHNILFLCKNIIRKYIKPGDTAVDATAGNGNDALFLAELVGDKGKIYAFDIQKQAIERTKSLLQKHNMLKRVELINDGHEHLDRYISSERPACIMFNLGYLPKSDHSIITKPETTINALKKSMQLLKPSGIISIVSYKGHPGGLEEYKVLQEYLKSIDQRQFSVLHCNFINQENEPPELFLLEKKQGEG